MLSTIIWLIHLILLIIILFGWLILPSWSLKYQLAIVPLVFLDWYDMDGQCILTRLEHYIKTGEWEQEPAEEGGPNFFQPLIEKLFNIRMTRKEASYLNHLLFIISWLITYFLFIFNIKLIY
jgi:hypothetical protein